MKSTGDLQSVKKRRWRQLSPLSDSWRRELPFGPGVYAFYGRSNDVLYVGKSKSLRNRVSSYFQSRADLIQKVRIFVPQISKIKICETKTEFEALLVEAKCIRELGPKYNSRLTDDRSPLYIAVTDEKFPRVLTARKTNLGGHEARSVYGPFLSGETVKKILKIARRLFPFCNQKKKRLSCFCRHLGLCPGVCTGEISRRRYLAIIKKLERFLAGDFAGLKVKLEKEMKSAAKRQRYEEAAAARDAAAALDNLSLAGEHKEETAVKPGERVEAIIKLLVKICHPECTNLGNFRIEGFDVSHLGGRLAAAAMVVFIGGIKETGEYRHFRIKTSERALGDPQMIAETVQRRLGHPDWEKPDLIVIDGGEPQLSCIKKTVFGPAQEQSLIYLGLAKNPDRLVIPVGSRFKTIRVSSQNLGFQLLQQVRDEAHRFSRRLHLKLRKNMLIG